MTSHCTRQFSRAAALFALVATPLRAQQTKTVRVSLPDAIQLGESRSETVAVARAGLSRATGNRMIARSQAIPQLSGTAGYTKTLKSQFSALASAAAPDTTGPASICAPRIPKNATQAQIDAALAQATTCSSGGIDLGLRGVLRD